MEHPALDRIAARVVESLARGRDVSPDSTLFLLRFYIASAADDAGAALAVALAHALNAAAACDDVAESAAWLAVFAEAASVADDDRIPDAARTLAARLRDAWPLDLAAPLGVATSAASADACLRGVGVLGAAAVQPALDELERIVAVTYRPGDGLAIAGRGDGRDALQARADAHLSVARALLTAFDLTARIPYAMLAEELVQLVRRAHFNFGAQLNCASARVLCRLALLHDDDGYRTAAVVAPGADYRDDAARMLRPHDGEADAVDLDDAARYGLALAEFTAATP